MSRIISGEIKPRLRLALAIQAASKGVLRASVLMGIPDTDHPASLPEAS